MDCENIIDLWKAIEDNVVSIAIALIYTVINHNKSFIVYSKLNIKSSENAFMSISRNKQNR